MAFLQVLGELQPRDGAETLHGAKAAMPIESLQ